MPSIKTIVYTDFYSLYECLIKLGTTKEKRLIIDIIIDIIIKANLNRLLEELIDKNKLTIRVEG
ncbi:hypothetical protein LOCC1_G007485 [Lachnellula occidentalis]|uniref:Uncharacterized protein n=1 Tax=Lachnellula occidentalis TaxID=215460 RepID=A0A8H8UER9_9HELO|nr:hypothetical protein LOCC1_G007485 [Lachnellula occidentalis]